ncbi:tRNA pseudouridine(38-40) synthase TruA [Archangium sp.]|uniref:tRNA pseudouridine synthase A n=1 Tax=Archangium sp. TaxID=1872627 RepID=UPI002D66E24F|nr:tRNA pseudouridine(38-40) synthase TruA [Archangium sp.]HYO52545.1 tRNA pseudouridine(38-40) synthase TruA [Archangium sp.]
MKRTPAALWIWYRGTHFRGYQRQPDGPTVQETLEDSLRKAGVPYPVMAAGRTDRGVHARMQVVSVRLPPFYTSEMLSERLPPHLPPELGLCVARRPPEGFHAQWSAAGKEYRYRLQLGGPPPEAWRPFVMETASEPRLMEGGALKPERVAELLGAAVGRRDFHAFHEHSSLRKPRTLESATLHELGNGLFEARLRGDGFGRYQVRYLVGSALLTAAGVLSEELFRSALDSGTSIPGLKAPAHGLLLWEVHYPPAVDPFPPEERARAPGLPLAPPFSLSTPADAAAA